MMIEIVGTDIEMKTKERRTKKLANETNQKGQLQRCCYLATRSIAQND
jgi:hypothetical protein